MKISQSIKDVSFLDTMTKSSTNQKEEFMKSHNKQSTVIKVPGQNISKHKLEKKPPNKISTLIEKPFDITSLQNIGSTILIGDNFYICTEQNRIHLNSEDQKNMKGKIYLFNYDLLF